MAETTITAFAERDLDDLLPLLRGYCDFYEVDPPDAQLLALCRALIADPDREGVQLMPGEAGMGQGVVARVWNRAVSPLSYSLSLARPIASAHRVTHVETRIAPANVSSGNLYAYVNQQQIQTHLLKLP